MKKLAQLDFGELEHTATPNATWNNPGEMVTAATPYVFTAAGVLLLFYLIAGGLGLMTSKGDPKMVQASKNKITHALIGFLIVFLAFWIVVIVGQIFGITVIEDIFG